MKTQKLTLALLTLALFSSCIKDSDMRITTNTFANKKVIPKGFSSGSSFSVVAKQKGEELFSKEVSQKIATILKKQGFEIKEPRNADYNLTFAFGMKKSTHVRDVPVYIPDYGHWYYGHYHHRYAYGYTIAYVPEVYNLFNKILLIEVYKNGDKAPIWQGTSSSYEEDSDLRDAIDYLLVTVFKHFGRNTRKYIVSKMAQDDPEVENLRIEYFQPAIGFDY